MGQVFSMFCLSANVFCNFHAVCKLQLSVLVFHKFAIFKLLRTILSMKRWQLSCCRKSNDAENCTKQNYNRFRHETLPRIFEDICKLLQGFYRHSPFSFETINKTFNCAQSFIPDHLLLIATNDS